MPISEFPQLLSRYMRRIRASAAGVASEVGLSREAVNNWRNGDSAPSRKHRDKVRSCAVYLRLTEDETNRLLAAAGFEPEYPAEANAAQAPGGAHAAVTTLLDRFAALRPYPIVMLLTQAHLGQPPEREVILDEAARRYGSEAVLHIQPPYSLAADPAAYFTAIAIQCGLNDIDSDYAFETALAQRIQERGRLFCLVSRFEQGDRELRQVLAGILRSLSEMYSGRLHLLICGGAALADLKYQGGDLSLLNIASAASWPELTETDLRAMAVRSGFEQVDATRALRLSGGHPLLADAAIALLSGTGDAPDDARLIDALATHEPLWQSFLPLLGDASTRAILAQHLQQERLSPAQPYLLDPLLRTLYWANLISVRQHADGRWLQWRCEAIRRAGRLILDGAGTRT